MPVSGQAILSSETATVVPHLHRPFSQVSLTPQQMGMVPHEVDAHPQSCAIGSHFSNIEGHALPVVLDWEPQVHALFSHTSASPQAGLPDPWMMPQRQS
jgi:hypothetical protein